MYNITRGQLITLHVFSVVAWWVAFVDMDSYYSSPISGPAIFLIPGIIIFYTLGWKKNLQTKGEEAAVYLKSKAKSNIKETFKLLGVIALLVGIIWFWFVQYPSTAYLSFIIAALLLRAIFGDKFSFFDKKDEEIK